MLFLEWWLFEREVHAFLIDLIELSLEVKMMCVDYDDCLVVVMNENGKKS